MYFIPKLRALLPLLLISAVTQSAWATKETDLTISGELAAPATVGDNAFLLTVLDKAHKPVVGAKVTLTVGMTSMDMGTTHPKVLEKGDGVYTSTVAFSMAGPWRITAQVELSGEKKSIKSFDFTPRGGSDTTMQGMSGMAGMNMSDMKGRFGDWPMQREGSGTSWLPDSSPMFMKALPKAGRYDLDLMGSFSLNYTDSSGPRGNSRFYSNSMPMLMARRETGGGTLGLSIMASLDPVFNGEYGYPNLFQTGETAYGHKLVDYQHPHDLIAEVAGSYSHPVTKHLRAFVYGGPVGEPALGGPTFMHRPSGMEIPEAPISHHWFDSTHISYGAVTAGLNTKKWQVEGSLFNGHEPDENRYAPDPVELNSASGRVTYNPTSNLSFNVGYGYLKSPESTMPGVDQHRLTAVGVWSLPLNRKDNFSVTALYGRKMEGGQRSDAYLLEGTLLHGATSIFSRYERVGENELAGIPAGTYQVNKLLFGAVQSVAETSGLEVGLGAYAGVYSFPSSLDPYYGKRPFTFGVFLRVRPGRMSMQ